MSHWRKHAGRLLRVGLTVAAFAYVSQSIDLAHVDDLLRTQDLWLLALAMLLLGAQILIGGWRSYAILKAMDARAEGRLNFLLATKILYISIFFNYCLPGTVGGDVVRMWMLRGVGISMPAAVNSVIVDRMVALCGLLIVALGTLPALADIAANFDPGVIFIALSGAAVAGIAILAHLETLLAPWQHHKLIHWLLHLAMTVRQIFLRPRVALETLALAALGQVVFCFNVYVVAQSLGLALSLMHAMILVPPVVLVAMLPISVGGWGVREAAFATAFSLVGVPASAAVILSLQVALLAVLASLPGGIAWLLYRRRHPMPHPAAEPGTAA